MKFSLAEIRHAHLICFPDDFRVLYLKHAVEHFYLRPLPLFDFIREYGHHEEMMVIAEKIVADLLNREYESDTT